MFLRRRFLASKASPVGRPLRRQSRCRADVSGLRVSRVSDATRNRVAPPKTQIDSARMMPKPPERMRRGRASATEIGALSERASTVDIQKVHTCTCFPWHVITRLTTRRESVPCVIKYLVASAFFGAAHFCFAGSRRAAAKRAHRRIRPVNLPPSFSGHSCFSLGFTRFFANPNSRWSGNWASV